MKSIRERQELKQWGGELISFHPTPNSNFGISTEHIRQSRITARVETSNAGSRVTLTRAATVGVFALGAKKKKPDEVSLIVVGNDYSQVVKVEGRTARAQAEAIARKINAVTGASSEPELVIEASSRIEKLAQLSDLRDKGVLTEDEFNAEKARVLAND